jgi:hypothetical protein
MARAAGSAIVIARNVLLRAGRGVDRGLMNAGGTAGDSAVGCMNWLLPWDLLDLNHWRSQRSRTEDQITTPTSPGL